MSDIQESIYLQRINQVIDHITLHLNHDLNLKTLAAIAGFSEFHFHRIFKSLVGETLNQFVWRVRVERAATLLRSNPQMQISEASTAVGFESLAGFSRAFKRRFNLSPSEWNRLIPLQKYDDNHTEYRIQTLPENCNTRFTVQFEKLPPQRLAYVRIQDSYRGTEPIEAGYQQLMNWYLNRGGDLDQTTLYGMSQDDPDITPLEKCRFDWCLRIPDNWESDDHISIRDFPECLVVMIEFTGDLALESQVWQYFWRCWLPRSAYQPLDLPAMEIYRHYPHVAGWWDTFYLNCAIPVTRLTNDVIPQTLSNS